MWKYNKTDELYHHGIKGQRWGFRRYQNPDGSLTPAGEERARELKKEFKQLTNRKLKGKIPHSINTRDRKKPLFMMKDDELDYRLNRLRKEQQIRNMEKDLAPTGKKIINTVRDKIMVPSLINAGKNVMTSYFTKAGHDLVEYKGGIKEIKKRVLPDKKTINKEIKKIASDDDVKNKLDDFNKKKTNFKALIKSKKK